MRSIAVLCLLQGLALVTAPAAAQVAEMPAVGFYHDSFSTLGEFSTGASSTVLTVASGYKYRLTDLVLMNNQSGLCDVTISTSTTNLANEIRVPGNSTFHFQPASFPALHAGDKLLLHKSQRFAGLDPKCALVYTAIGYYYK